MSDLRYCGDEGMPPRHAFKGGACIWCPTPAPSSPEALDLRHASGGRILNPEEDLSDRWGAYIRGDGPEVSRDRVLRSHPGRVPE